MAWKLKGLFWRFIAVLEQPCQGIISIPLHFVACDISLFTNSLCFLLGFPYKSCKVLLIFCERSFQVRFYEVLSIQSIISLLILLLIEPDPK